MKRVESISACRRKETFHEHKLTINKNHALNCQKQDMTKKTSTENT